MINRLLEHTAQLAITSIFVGAAYGLHNTIETEKSYAGKYPSLSQSDLTALKSTDMIKAITVGLGLGLVTADICFPIGSSLRRRKKAEPKALQP